MNARRRIKRLFSVITDLIDTVRWAVEQRKRHRWDLLPGEESEPGTNKERGRDEARAKGSVRCRCLDLAAAGEAPRGNQDLGHVRDESVHHER